MADTSAALIVPDTFTLNLKLCMSVGWLRCAFTALMSFALTACERLMSPTRKPGDTLASTKILFTVGTLIVARVLSCTLGSVTMTRWWKSSALR